MGGRHRLSAGLERLYPDHRAVEAVAHRRLFAALEAELGPFDPLARREAWRTAALGVERDATLLALAEARHTRRTGRGRRPSTTEVERLAHRAGLANTAYTQAVDRLRALAAERTPADDFADRVRQGSPGLPGSPL